MKNFQQKLLIVLALCLCAMCAWQWKFQTVQRAAIADEQQANTQKELAIQGYTNSIHTMDGKIAEMDQRITELKKSLEVTNEFIIGQEREIARVTASNDTLVTEISQYSNSLDSFQTKLQAAYDGIKKQNEAVTNLIEQRDDFFKRLNDSIKERNDIVAKYNDVVDRLNKLQSGTRAFQQKL